MDDDGVQVFVNCHTGSTGTRKSDYTRILFSSITQIFIWIIQHSQIILHLKKEKKIPAIGKLVAHNYNTNFLKYIGVHVHREIATLHHIIIINPAFSIPHLNYYYMMAYPERSEKNTLKLCSTCTKKKRKKLYPQCGDNVITAK